MPSCTRCRATDEHVPTEAMAQYYADRASFGLLITEGTMIQRGYSTFGHEPGIYTREQVDAWKKVTDAVHDKGGIIYLQIMHGGRATVDKNLSAPLKVMGPSALGIKGHPCPSVFTRDGSAQEYPATVEPMTEEQIKECVGRYARAARNAMAAGFDGVQIQAGNGFLIDQFINESCNNRTDAYGGSIPNRCRFLLEVVDAVKASIGANRVAVRLSPLDSFLDMTDSDPEATTHYIAEQLNTRKIAFVEVVRGDTIGPERGAEVWVRERFTGVLIVNYDVTLQEGEEYIASGKAEAVSFGRLGVANPDLVFRIIKKAALNDPDGATLFAGGEKGYNDYPTLETSEEAAERIANYTAPEEEQERSAVKQFSAEESMIARSRGNSVSARRVSFSEKLVSQEVSIEPIDPEEAATPSKQPVSGDALLKPLLFPTGSLMNRCVMGTLPRQRAGEDHVPTEAMVKYYQDRSQFGLILSEPIAVQPGYHSYVRSPGITTKQEVEGWKKVTTAVHEKGGVIFCCLHHAGRVTVEGNLEGETAVSVCGPTEHGVTGAMCPAVFAKSGESQPYPSTVKALRKPVLEWIVKLYAVAAKNAMAAGFDGVEIQAGNGFLIDSFLRDGGNQGREDEYGGTLENRARLLLQVVDAVSVIGADKVGVRLSPLDSSNGMSESDVDGLLAYVGKELQKRKIAFIEISNGSEGNYTATDATGPLEKLRPVFKGMLFSDENLTPEQAEGRLQSNAADAAVFTLAAVANPDLVDRIARQCGLQEVNMDTLFTEGETGYNDYLTATALRQKSYEERLRSWRRCRKM
ncbi:N-ethylmaleimide reductase-like protein [Angomonas deanei]|uniref:NADH:flavin oxidoreductase / NADH oxidase family, putative n=1 Tax=Angomonas deanei TaxID=59799 RepID=A0A7G2CJS6_9TRYP|nr:N-ethylmaleimide reductase-like protein [Angomonas deanei]CAD2219204.1 NADH:flavin oxidoreductase / NADH oxidase family, putative [Angomonas deanei]|eukprot:EPY29445.1 N-ethylmaleimide reductase-like protein [Angomonas deanei]